LAVNNYLPNEYVDNNSNRITAYFSDKNDAYRAMTELQQQGFGNDQIGLATLGSDVSSTGSSGTALLATSEGQTHEEHQSFWHKVKNFFAGEDHDDITDLGSSSSYLGWLPERATYYSQGLRAGGAVLTVTGENVPQAQQILESCGGDLRESGFNSPSGSGTVLNSSPSESFSGESETATGIETLAEVDQRRIQLRGELLRAHKQSVELGEVTLRKQVVTENPTIHGPVTREELVIERMQPINANVSEEIGANSEIHIPLSEERIIPEKQTAVTEEVQVGTRQVTSIEHVSSDVHHEELNVEVNKDLAEHTALNPDIKKPAA